MYIISGSTLRKVGITVKPFQEASALMTGSVYDISNHPMFLGFVLLLSGVVI